MDWVNVASSFLNATGSFAAGEGIKAGKQAEARQLRDNAAATMAVGTRKAHEERRKGEQVKSNAVALNAAGGGGMDAAMIERMARIESDTDYNVLASLYSAQSEADNLRYAARVSNAQGKAASRNSMLGAIPSILDMGDQIFSSDVDKTDATKAKGSGKVTL